MRNTGRFDWVLLAATSLEVRARMESWLEARQTFIGLRNSLFNATRAMQKHTAALDKSDVPRPDLAPLADSLFADFMEELSDDFMREGRAQPRVQRREWPAEVARLRAEVDE